jgi:hypothetical protein
MQLHNLDHAQHSYPINNTIYTAKKRYKGMHTIKILHFYWWSDIVNTVRRSLKMKLINLGAQAWQNG